MNKTIVIKDERYINHKTQPGHPESPQRLVSIYERIKQAQQQFVTVAPREATADEVALNHGRDYIDTISATAGRDFVSLDPDTTTSAGSWEAAVLAVGGVLTGIDMIISAEADNGFVLARPPGHHAEGSRAMGFCLFNNIAVGAHYLLRRHHLKRVLIIDWDIHHGNGTQNSFYDNPDVLYFSTHQYPYYPGTGAFEETGTGAGQGYTLNVPLPGGQDDRDFLRVFEEILGPVAEEFQPEFILVSAGYDIYNLDPLGTMGVTPQGFAAMTFFLKEVAEKLCGGRLLLSLEGGYHVDGIAESVSETIGALTGNGTRYSERHAVPDEHRSSTVVDQTIAKVKSCHGSKWHSLK